MGRTPNTGNLQLDKVGIDVDEYGGLIVDSDLRTTACGGNVYGAGDVLGRPFLASTGVAQAVVCFFLLMLWFGGICDFVVSGGWALRLCCSMYFSFLPFSISRTS